jgi:predicted transcriptional regulator
VQLVEMKQHIEQALPAGIAADRFIRVTLTAIQLQPELLERERKHLEALRWMERLAIMCGMKVRPKQ